MKNKLKMWLRRLAIRQLIKFVDRAEERLQAWQVSLRESLREAASQKSLAAGAVAVKQSVPVKNELARVTVRESHADSAGRRRVSFNEWEMRRAGVAPVSKKEARRRRGMAAREFDLRFAR
jgi:hypothetical protein